MTQLLSAASLDSFKKKKKTYQSALNFIYVRVQFTKWWELEGTGRYWAGGFGEIGPCEDH